MKSLGILRKIDELGRIVIPKEIRVSQGWDEGQAMEMFMDDSSGENMLVMRAYRKSEEMVGAIETLEAYQRSVANGEDFDMNKFQEAIAMLKKYA